jgi:hypothetical protein
VKYIALRDSLDHKRSPAYCVRGHVYDFASDPGVHFEAIEEAPLPVVVVERPRDDKAALLMEAEELGLDVDKRWSVARLRDEISKAKEAEDGDE